MTARGKTIWLNLSILGILLAAALILETVMHGSTGAAIYARSLREGSAADRLKAATALQSFGSSGTPAVPALLAVLQDPDDGAAPAAARALREIDAQAAYEYATTLTKKTGPASPATIEVFGNLGPVAWRAIPLLRMELDQREYIRPLIPALIEMGDYSDEVVAAVIRDSRDPVYSARKWNAMLDFGQLADLGDRIRPELQRLSLDPAPAVAGQAKIILAGISEQRTYALSGLAEFPRQNQNYQEYALKRLSKQGARAADAIPDIVAELRSKSVLIRFMATWTLRHMGSAARAALPQLRAALGDSSSLVRDGATDAIRAIEAAP